MRYAAVIAYGTRPVQLCCSCTIQARMPRKARAVRRLSRRPWTLSWKSGFKEAIVGSGFPSSAMSRRTSAGSSVLQPIEIWRNVETGRIESACTVEHAEQSRGSLFGKSSGKRVRIGTNQKALRDALEKAYRKGIDSGRRTNCVSWPVARYQRRRGPRSARP